MKQFRCSDIFAECGWVAREDDEEVLFADIASHADDVHGMDQVPTEVRDMIRAVISEVPAE